MGRRSFEQTSEAIRAVLETHAGRTLSVQDIAREASVSPETAKRDLELLERYGVVFKDERAVYESYVIATPNKDALFSLPLTTHQREASERVYLLVKWICEHNDHPIGRTVRQKMASDIASILYPDAPHGWYRFGKVLVLQDNGQDMGVFQGPDENEQRVCEEVFDRYAHRGARSAMLIQYEANAHDHPIYLQRLKAESSLYSGVDNEIRYHRMRDLRTLIVRSEIFPESSQLAFETALGLEEIFRDAYERSIDPEGSLEAIRDTFDALWTLIAHLEFARSLVSFYDPKVLELRFNADVKLARDATVESFRAIGYEVAYDLPKGSFLDSFSKRS
jgi:DNA-binding transcriptional regulator YhcF (GntR family)